MRSEVRNGGGRAWSVDRTEEFRSDDVEGIL